VRSFAISRNCSKLAMVSEDLVEIWTWSMQNRRWIQCGTLSLKCKYCALSPNGQLLVTSSIETHTLWNISEGSFKEKTSWENSANYNLCYCEFSPDGKLLATCEQRDVCLRNVIEDTPKQILKHDAPEDEFLRNFAFSPDGSLLAAVLKFQVSIWNVQNQDCIRILKDPMVPGFCS